VFNNDGPGVLIQPKPSAPGTKYMPAAIARFIAKAICSSLDGFSFQAEVKPASLVSNYSVFDAKKHVHESRRLVVTISSPGPEPPQMFKKQEYLCDHAAFDCETISAVSFDNKSIAGHRFESLRY
jgi:hypothetical protein